MNMALMFPRVAQNYVKNGYYPTDISTLNGICKALKPCEHGTVRILDPCAGTGLAVAGVSDSFHAVNEHIFSYGIEYDRERADELESMVDYALHSDLMDSIVSARSFGLLWLNPPYGDLVNDSSGSFSYEGKGRKRMEKLFYKRTIGLLSWGGVLVFILPHYTLDTELVSWLVNHFDQISIYQAAVDDFKQVVIFGRRIKSSQRPNVDVVRSVRDRLLSIGDGSLKAPELPDQWGDEAYIVPGSSLKDDQIVFHRASLDGDTLSNEIGHGRLGMWNNFDSHFKTVTSSNRPPARALSDWHLALSLAAGAISGVVTSATGRCLIVKGDTHKCKTSKSEVVTTDDCQKSIKTMTDRFVPVIMAWEMTQGDAFGDLITITSAPATSDSSTDTSNGEEAGERIAPLFQLGRVVCTVAVNELIENMVFDPRAIISRHSSGDWGDVPDEDRAENERSLKHGYRLMSVYKLTENTQTPLTVWVITEADRSSTTVLLPSDY
jgi:hypothetical protein